MPRPAGSDSPANESVKDSPSPEESVVRVALREQWGIRDELRPMQTAASRTWLVDGHVVKLAHDEPAHFTAGLLASEAVDRAGITTGIPVRTRAREVCVAPPLLESWMLAVLHRVDGTHLSMWAVPPAVLGAFLGRLHHIMRGCPAAGAWTPDDVLGHMTRGVTAAHPATARQMIMRAVTDVSGYYATAPPMQLLYGGWAGHLLHQWRGHQRHHRLGRCPGRQRRRRHRLLDSTRRERPDRAARLHRSLLDGYRNNNDLSPADAAAVPLFQRLRIASRACYVTDPDALARVEAWMRNASAE